MPSLTTTADRLPVEPASAGQTTLILAILGPAF